MDDVYYITDKPKDLEILSLIHQGHYRTLERVHLNILVGKKLEDGLEGDVIAKEVAQLLIAPVLLEAGVVEQDEGGDFSTSYSRLEVKDLAKYRDALIASMEPNTRDMVRQARGLSDKKWRRSSAYMQKKVNSKVVNDAIDKIGVQLRIILNAPIDEDDSKNSRVEIAFMGLKELKND